MAYQKPEKKEINTTEVVKYLTRSFNRAVNNSALGNKAVRIINGQVSPTELYKAQVEFCYLIDNIQRGPSYIAPKIIQDANDMIAILEKQ